MGLSISALTCTLFWAELWAPEDTFLTYSLSLSLSPSNLGPVSVYGYFTVHVFIPPSQAFCLTLCLLICFCLYLSVLPSQPLHLSDLLSAPVSIHPSVSGSVSVTILISVPSVNSIWEDSLYPLMSYLKVDRCHISKLSWKWNTLIQHMHALLRVHVSFQKHTIKTKWVKHLNQWLAEHLKDRDRGKK